MLVTLRPDATSECWNSWPTEKVGQALADVPFWCELIQAHVVNELREGSVDAAAVRVAHAIRRLVEDALKSGDAEELKDRLVTFALSRVDWFQLAQRRIERASPSEPIHTDVFYFSQS
jgi:hypothetical protein